MPTLHNPFMRLPMHSRLQKMVWAIVLSVLAIDIVMQVLGCGEGDQKWLLLATSMWMQGKTLYVDIFEINPPLIIWLYSIPVWLSLHLAFLSDTEWLAIMGITGVATSVLLCMRLIKLHPVFSQDAPKQRLFALLLVGTLLFFTTQVYFFDRDHIFFVLTFPYLLRCMPSLDTKISYRLRIAIGLCAAIGFCIKPHTVILFIAIQIMRCWPMRSFSRLWNIENAIIAASAMLYGMCIVYFTPAYFTIVWPMAMATYAGFSHTTNKALFLAAAFMSAGLIFIDFRPRYVTPYRRDMYYFIGICIAFLVYALAGNGWGYTFNPLLCMLLFVSGWALWEYQWLRQDAIENNLPSRQFLFGMRATAINLTFNILYILLYIGVFFFGSACLDKKCAPDPFERYIEGHAIHSFATFSTNFRRWTSLARQTHTQWNTRFNHLWMLPTLLHDTKEQRAPHQWILDYVGRAYAQDLVQRPPDVVFVDSSNAFFGSTHPVDIPAFLSSVPEFKAVWSHYHYVSTIDACATSESKTPSRADMDCRFDIYNATLLPDAPQSP